jgi:Double sensory domain of two-component sensor kinase
MLLSRFWYLILALAFGVATFILFVSVQMYNRTGKTAMSEALSADSSAVDWFLRDDARKRSSALIPIALAPEITAGLSKASGDAKIDGDTRRKTASALRKLNEETGAELKFDYLWAVDAGGRVVAAAGFEHNEDWELGGYSSVAQALHGWILDDAWVWKGRILRIVTRPVEKEAGSEPVGAIIGAKIVDDAFARAVTKRTGAAVGFYADGARTASGAPEGFDKANLDEITRDLKHLDTNKDYQEKGRSEVRVIGDHLGVVYARLPGEAWDLGAGYAVGRLAVSVSSPFDVLNQADKSDQQKVPTILLVGIILAAAGIGLFFSYLEHTAPLSAFKKEAARLAQGQMDVLQPSRFRGAYKKIAADLNDGIEKVAVKGGAPRKAADLEQVLGPIPAQPMMSAFAVPGPGSGPVDSPSRPSFPKAPPVASERGAQRLRQSGQSGQMAAVTEPDASSASDSENRRPGPPPAPKRQAPPVPAAAPQAAPPVQAYAPAPEPVAEASYASAMPDDGGEFNELEDWRRVYEEFLAVKRQCGEPTAPLTFEKFKGTLQRNKDALVARHNCSRVKFTVYVKDGKAALKASPVK